VDIPWPFVGNGQVNTFLLLHSRFLVMQQLDYNNGKAVFVCGPCQDDISKGQNQLIGCSVWESVNTGLEPEAEE
jgi:hypothetical protein